MNTIASRFIDISPLTGRADFRRLWAGTTCQSFGAKFTSLAVLYQVWEFTHDTFWIGFVGLITALPTIVFGLSGGAFADAIDRRAIVLWTTAGAMVVSLMLAAQVALQLDSLLLLLILAALQGAFDSFGRPARKTFIPHLLPPHEIAAGVALMHTSFQASVLMGPALAGLVISGWGVTTCYALEAAAFCVAFCGVMGLPRIQPSGTNSQRGIRAIIEGLQFIKARSLLSGSLLSDLAVTLLAMPIALFPAINQEKFGGSPETLGFFLSSIAVGGVFASVLSGWLTRRTDIGRIQLVAAASWGGALLGAGLTGDLWSILAFLAIAGAADAIAVIARGALLQVATPDEYRGRIGAVELVAGLAGPELGNFRAGLTATYFSPLAVLSVGGLSCIVAVAAIATRSSELWRFSTEKGS